MSILFLMLAIIISCLLFCLKNRIKLCATVVKVAAEVMDHTKNALLVPFVFYFISFLYFMYWVVIATNLYSCGTVS